MCEVCDWRENGTEPIRNETVSQLVELAEAVDCFGNGGGHAHIVIEDGNVADEYIQWCLNEVAVNTFSEDPEELDAERQFLEVMLAASHEERISALVIRDSTPVAQEAATIEFGSLSRYIVPVAHPLTLEKTGESTFLVTGSPEAIEAMQDYHRRQEARHKSYCENTAIWGCHCGAKQ